MQWTISPPAPSSSCVITAASIGQPEQGSKRPVCSWTVYCNPVWLQASFATMYASGRTLLPSFLKNVSFIWTPSAVLHTLRNVLQSICCPSPQSSFPAMAVIWTRLLPTLPIIKKWISPALCCAVPGTGRSFCRKCFEIGIFPHFCAFL